MSSQNFIRTIENFTCEKCGNFVIGSGYTNHCPKCLWSKHVDNNPGDRKSECNYLMEPLALEIEGSESIIIHKCIKCGFEKRNKTATNDDTNALIELSAKPKNGIKNI